MQLIAVRNGDISSQKEYRKISKRGRSVQLKNVKNAKTNFLWKNCMMNSLFLEDLPESTPPPPPVFSYKEKTCGGGQV